MRGWSADAPASTVTHVNRGRIALAALLLVLPTAASAGAPFRSVRSGAVSMLVPSAWRVAKQRGAIQLVAAARTAEAGFRPNVAVVAGQPRGRLSVEAWRRQIMAGLSGLPSGRTKAASRILRLPAGPAVEVSVRGATGGRTIRWLIYAIDAGRKAYVVTFTTGGRAWARYAPLFRAMAQSIRISR